MDTRLREMQGLILEDLCFVELFKSFSDLLYHPCFVDHKSGQEPEVEPCLHDNDIGTVSKTQKTNNNNFKKEKKDTALGAARDLRVIRQVPRLGWNGKICERSGGWIYEVMYSLCGDRGIYEEARGVH
ncbi:hypothetical protein TNIN_139831 [Trichonephila inaurata madagascariensis]|uniref:Uncharacterized protein n=1 Tax=Trichonephila inaurata madagascariensis TaxID=2747483 RepID=A0A8X6WRJ5_9ARAC|nr:hypothetical protein TNIN_139831 [Trichonephila inaurata madagascariensis]